MIYDAEHFFDGFKHNPDYALQTLQAAADGRRARGRPLRHQRRHAARARSPRPSSAVRQALRVPSRHPLPQRLRRWPSPTPWPPSAAGATQVQGTINGIGERCGNVDLVQRHRQPRPQVRGYDVLRPGSLRAADRGLALRLRDGQHELPRRPAVRRRQRLRPQGRHARPRRRARTRPATSTSTRPRSATSAASWSASCRASRTSLRRLAKYGLDHDKALMAKILDRVQDLENEGYEFEAAEASFDLLVEKAGRAVPAAGSSGSATTSTSRPSATATPVTEATVKLRVGDAVEHTVSEGDGPVNALDGALRKALQPHYPAARGDAPGRLQGPRRQRPGRDRRAGPRRDREHATTTTSGAPSASARTSSRRAGWRWSMHSSTSSPRTRGRRPPPGRSWRRFRVEPERSTDDPPT